MSSAVQTLTQVKARIMTADVYTATAEVTVSSVS
jgi:hypothetical protein